MSSRFNAARPKRAGETYARQHHAGAGGDDGEPDSKKVKFDVRNPSALAPDNPDDDEDDTADAFLEADADVIRGGAATKRGAVNIDGYDSDSDREEMGALRAGPKEKTKKEVDVDDMFAEEEDGDEMDEAVDDTTGKKSKEVRFLDADQIEGQEARSKSGGRIRLDEEPSSDDDDEEAVELAIQEEGLDAEVGLGGLKKHAPKVEAFNLKAEQEEGRFDEAGNYVRKAADPDAVHDRWLEGVSKKDMRRAAEAHSRREAEQRQQRRRDDGLLTADLLRALILQLERGETPEDALHRLGRRQAKAKAKKKPLPKWKLKKQLQKSSDAMDVDPNAGAAAAAEKRQETEEDREQARIKQAIDAITDAASKLLERDRPDIYDRERERLVREYGREADEPWVEPPRTAEEGGGEGGGDGEDECRTGDAPAAAAATRKMWEFRWTDGRDDAAKQGPFDGPTMKAWQDAGYFGEGVEFREVDGDEGWTRVVAFV